MNRFIAALFSVVLTGISATLFAQDFSAYEKRSFIKGTDTLPYRILLPENFDASKKYPLVFVLHGSGERGNDNEKQLVHGGSLFLKKENRTNYPAIVIFPQCPESSYWADVDIVSKDGKRTFDFMEEAQPTVAMTMLQGLITKVMKDYKIKKDQVYVTGLSMGGMGTFEIVRRNPKLFAAALPICGGANPATAKYLIKTKWWIFHGEADDVVPVELSQNMAEALRKEGASVMLTVYPGVNHNSWDSAFGEKDFLEWMFSIKK